MTGYCLCRVIRLITALVIAATFHDHAMAAQAAAAKMWDAFTNDFMEATFEARPNYAVWAGRHEWSTAAVAQHDVAVIAAPR